MLPLIVAVVVVIGLAAALVLVPLFRKSGSAAAGWAAESRSEVQELETQRDNLYQSLRDLEFDRQVGKVTEEDYETLSARFKSQAAEVLRQLVARTDGAGQAQLDAALEAEIRARRQVGRAAVPVAPRPPEPVAADVSPQAVLRFCTNCGQRLNPTDRFCANCGTPVAR